MISASKFEITDNKPNKWNIAIVVYRFGKIWTVFFFKNFLLAKKPTTTISHGQDLYCLINTIFYVITSNHFCLLFIYGRFQSSWYSFETQNHSIWPDREMLESSDLKLMWIFFSNNSIKRFTLIKIYKHSYSMEKRTKIMVLKFKRDPNFQFSMVFSFPSMERRCIWLKHTWTHARIPSLMQR